MNFFVKKICIFFDLLFFSNVNKFVYYFYNKAWILNNNKCVYIYIYDLNNKKSNCYYLNNNKNKYNYTYFYYCQDYILSEFVNVFFFYNMNKFLFFYKNKYSYKYTKNNIFCFNSCYWYVYNYYKYSFIFLRNTVLNYSNNMSKFVYRNSVFREKKEAVLRKAEIQKQQYKYLVYKYYFAFKRAFGRYPWSW